MVLCWIEMETQKNGKQTSPRCETNKHTIIGTESYSNGATEDQKLKQNEIYPIGYTRKEKML